MSGFLFVVTAEFVLCLLGAALRAAGRSVLCARVDDLGAVCYRKTHNCSRCAVPFVLVRMRLVPG